MKRILLSICFFLMVLELSAHAIWIETTPVGKKGQVQQIKIYYGEYSTFSPDKVADWYSDVKAFELWLVGPDAKKVQLSTQAFDDHYESSFTPQADGNYTLLISHSAKDLGGTTIYQFNSSASVAVGKAALQEATSSGNPLKMTITGNKAGKAVAVQGFYNHAVSDKIEAVVFSPKGWTKTIEGNEKGIVEFIPEWKGKYLIEITRTDKETGQHYGKEYTSVWRSATYLTSFE